MKMIEVSNLIEEIFSHAVALDQSGGMRNTIYVIENEIYILSFDHTVLIRFRLRASETPFHHPISFRANDYDSNRFYEDNGQIVFVSKQGGYERRKSCSVVDTSPEQIRELFVSYSGGEKSERTDVHFSRDVLSLLDRDLSHIEFSGEKGGVVRLIQRNIYSGSVIEIQPEKTMLSETLDFDLEPIAMKTNDFAALFMFQEALKFSFARFGEEAHWIAIKSPRESKRSMNALVACCLYDEIIQIKEAKR